MITISKPVIGEDEKKAVKEVLDSGFLAQGDLVEEFEKRFAQYVGVKYAVATNNGTSALHTALAALGIGRHDEVITTPFSFIATGSSVLMVGAKPVFCDIEQQTYNLDPRKIKGRITERTKAILVVHLYGQPCDMTPILEIAAHYHLPIIEDCAQAPGAEYNGRKVGSLGKVGCFSFYATKNMTAGEGGMLVTNDGETAEKARMIINHGQNKKYLHAVLGYNYRLTNIAAAIGVCQLQKLDEFNEKRRENASFLTDGIKTIKGLLPPRTNPVAKHVFHQYTIRVTNDFTLPRDTLKKKLNALDIGAAVYYPVPMHKQELFKRLGYTEDFPEAEKASEQVLSLPVHASLLEEDLERIVEVVCDA